MVPHKGLSTEDTGYVIVAPVTQLGGLWGLPFSGKNTLNSVQPQDRQRTDWQSPSLPPIVLTCLTAAQTQRSREARLQRTGKWWGASSNPPHTPDSTAREKHKVWAQPPSRSGPCPAPRAYWHGSQAGSPPRCQAHYCAKGIGFTALGLTADSVSHWGKSLSCLRLTLPFWKEGWYLWPCLHCVLRSELWHGFDWRPLNCEVVWSRGAISASEVTEARPSGMEGQCSKCLQVRVVGMVTWSR